MSWWRSRASTASKEVVNGSSPSARLSDRDSISFFFTKFPEDAKHSELWKLFAKFGYVGDVFLAKKLDKWGRKFGFVKYKEVLNVEDLATRLEHVWFDNVRLKVNLARFGREERSPVAVQYGEERSGGGAALVIPGVSFKAAMTKVSGAAQTGGVESACLQVNPSEDMLRLLEAVYVGELRCIEDPIQVQQRFVMEGIGGVRITGMGDSLVLLLESVSGAVGRAAKSHEMWWWGMFKSVKKWSLQCVAVKIRIWLKVLGIPLHVWDGELFKTIRAFLGEFLDFDEDTIGRRRLDLARILVIREVLLMKKSR